ncbi:hypothetical protein F5Y11DRAFT_326818 [Daldinia sp. FL1419]|nr:hypothetical protein F5Y11DRAFT_326818 [Daldinia sp. FL1419]
MLLSSRPNNPVTGKQQIHKASWRNGSAFDSRSKGYPFKSGRGHLFLHGLTCYPQPGRRQTWFGSRWLGSNLGQRPRQFRSGQLTIYT